MQQLGDQSLSQALMCFVVSKPATHTSLGHLLFQDGRTANADKDVSGMLTKLGTTGPGKTVELLALLLATVSGAQTSC